MTDEQWPATRARVLRSALGVGVVVGTYGVAFGALAVSSGLSATQALALSTLTFTGASQFALVGVLGTGGSALAGVATAWLLGSRNALYGMRLAPLLAAESRRRRLLAAHLVIDESTAVAVAQDDDRAARLGFWATGTSVFVCWNLATVAGALGTEALGDPQAWGLDAAVGAAFLALLWPRLRDRRALPVALGGAAVALAATPLLPAGVPVLLAAVVAVVVGWPEPAARQAGA
ncbi:MAG: AzlC family ABC transporter permease [Actinomycetota bacterium]|nr:AzlC family ABC transporter permease [Actinomycetota bacterium]